MNVQKSNTQDKLAFQKLIAAFGIILFIGKIIAWKLTDSDSVFSDAMESIVNVISAFMGLYSLYLAAKPKDEDHPYGHGKVEFVTSGIEGAPDRYRRYHDYLRRHQQPYNRKNITETRLGNCHYRNNGYDQLFFRVCLH
nr:cation transporter [Scytonema sp. UIC 10036]